MEMSRDAGSIPAASTNARFTVIVKRVFSCTYDEIFISARSRDGRFYQSTVGRMKPVAIVCHSAQAAKKVTGPSADNGQARPQGQKV
jgi:hypothetical protein